MSVFDEFDTLNSGKIFFQFFQITYSFVGVPLISFRDISGTITLAEFKAALFRFNYTDEEIEAIFRKVVST